MSPDPTVLDGFLAAADAHPGRTAIADDGRSLSYAALRTRVRAVADRLGPGPGVVAVPAIHTPDTVAGLLGVWLAGGAYCPVDPAFPAARRQAMLTAAGCQIRLDPNLGGHGGAELAYILFTSGSTGEPKPVLTPQAAIGAAVRSVRELFGLTPADRVLQFASLSWDTCFEEILPTLTSGACLVFHPDAYAGSFPRLLRMLDRERVTVLNLPTAFWHELVGYLRESGQPLPASLRLVIVGGEPVRPARLADWHALPTGGRPRLLNTYGCTETTLITHAAELTAAGSGGSPAAGQVPIGRPLPHVVERLSAEGELLIGGPSLAAGYRGLPAATAARFVTVDSARFFRTGDRVRRLPDGSLVPAGRIDQELKVRGIRVDPAEVEAHIAAHPAVGAVAVTGVRVADHTVLAAYVIAAGPHTDPAGLPASIVDHLRGRVPAHLVPSRIRVVERLAYTATGKLDRRRIEETLA
ncbi:MAG: AMP-binding protein [Micromonosporaceae bacterium]|nr:AMP-binding protein [Micromonosporaceae bacterium]